jgi:AcrR family transcriptional regulator
MPPATAERPYHHGHLRAALLRAAEETLREQGANQVTLRSLARKSGVSHGAPRHHFPDRQSLLDALAAVGYDRLADQLTAAIEQGGEDFGAQFRAAGTAFTRFAIDNASLMDLMLTARSGGDPSAKAPERPYLIVGALVVRGQQAGRLRAGDPDRLRLLIIAAFQGIAMLVTSLGLPAGQVDALVGDAVRLFTD